ncbi:MAG: hypothetical protein B7733_13355 [Myxococcales bacterium FL481]|nr:MAG: hypothetical protein B7733_13355 [Myxococcales bacterium FL481]
MEEIIEGLIQKVGLTAEQADAVVEFLKEHADKLPALLSGGGLGAVAEATGLADKLPGGLGGLLGGGD